jgi:hypothetical protein
MWKQMIAGLMLVSLCGCIQTKDELTINADGSGQVRMETKTSIPAELTDQISSRGQMGGLGGGVIYPPISESEAQQFFPGKDFTVTVKQQKGEKDDVTTTIEASFKNINALLTSPYGRAHQLSVKIAAGALVVKGVTGMETAARYAEMKDDGDMGMAMPGIADLQKKKNEMRAEFRVTLPNAITTANGTKAGKTASWVVERAKCKDAEEFARLLGTVSEASCPADGLNMAPVTPVRLGLLPFAELAAGAGPDTGAVMDTNKIAAAAKFVPYGLSVTRSLDLSGAGGSQESSAELTGAVEIPREFAPPKWGAPKLEEATDAKGNDLKPAANGDENGFSMRSHWSSGSENGDDEETKTNSVQRHVVTLDFHPPDWKINEIGRVKGSVSLQYFGSAQQVVKLTNAVPATWIRDQAAMNISSFDSSDKPLASEALTGLGLTLSVQMGMIQGGMTMLTLQVKGTQATLTDAQVFDAAGKPWPTTLAQMDFGGGEEGTCEIMVAGKPQAPLSLALVATGGGASVTVPILVENVPLTK